jgi:hypothetical protein
VPAGQFGTGASRSRYGCRGRGGEDVGLSVRRGVEHHAVVVLGHLLDLQREVVDDPLHLRAPLAEVGGGGLQCGHASIVVVEVGLDA